MGSKNQGFTLTEMAVVLVISALLLLMSIEAIDTQYEINSYYETQNRINTIKIALENYKLKFGRLPCPASNVDAESSATYLQEVSSCTNASCSAGVSCPASGVAIGAVPAKTLGLGNQVGLDSWNNKITYAIDQRFTQDQGGNCQVNGKIIIVDANNNPINSAGSAEYVIVSAGKDKAGAYTDQGVLGVACSSTRADKENCNGDITFMDGIFSDGNNNNYFDDVLAWNLNSNARQCPAGVTGCIMWFDADDVCTITQNAGAVTAWQDKSTNNLSAVAVSSPTYVTSTSNLTNGNPYLSFSSGATNLLSVSSLGSLIPNNNFTQIIVFLPSSVRAAAVTNAANSNLYNPTTSDRVFGTNGSGFLQFNMAGSVTDTTAALTTAPTIGTIKVDATTGQTMYTNGVQTGTSAVTSSTFSSPSNFNIGGVSSQGAFDGRILEIVLYNRVLTTGEQQQIESYLAAKWGIVY